MATSLEANLQALHSSDLDERLKAIAALAQTRDRVILPRMLELLKDQEPRIRIAAMQALEQVESEQVMPAIEAMLTDANPEVREAAQVILQRLKATPYGAAEPSPVLPPAFPVLKAIPAVEIPTLPAEMEKEEAPPAAPQVTEPGLSREEIEPATDPALKEAQDVQFSVYYPRDVLPQKWYPMTAYIYKALAAEKVVADAQYTLGGLMATVRRVIEAARQSIPQGTMITATPHIEGFQFNPPTINIGFYEDWHRLEFKLRAITAPLNQATNGILNFTVEGIIVADIPLAVYVGESEGSSDMVTMTQKLYKAIFCSYSHDDGQIVERVERAYKILGFDFLRDVNALRSGEDWNEGLYKLIEDADIFQLFWSSTAAQSEYVTREWKHALSLDRDNRNFIRPVYWENPMPPVPPELNHIHFAYEPTLDD